MVHNTYKDGAENLMNVLCNSDAKGAREKALEDIQKLHHATHSISDWLSSLGNCTTTNNIHSNSTISSNISHSTSQGAIQVGIVLEAGFDFKN